MVENQQQSFQSQAPKTNIYKSLFFISIFVLLLSNSFLIYRNRAVKCPIAVPPVTSPTIPPADMSCGGISGEMCPDGYNCHLNGNYPDASGTCVKTTTKNDPSTYTCPGSEWVDCMPSVDAPKNYQCENAFLTWAKAHCPGFKGAAL